MADTTGDPVNDRLARWYPPYDPGLPADPHDLSFLDDPPVDPYEVQSSSNTSIQWADSSLGSAEDSGVTGLPSSGPPVYPTALAVMNRNLYMGGIQPAHLYVHFGEQDADPDDNGFAADLFDAVPDDGGLSVDDDAEGEDDDGQYEVVSIYSGGDRNAFQEHPSRELESDSGDDVSTESELSDSDCSDMDNDDACASNNEGREDDDCEASTTTSYDLSILGKVGVYEDEDDCTDDSDDSDSENYKVHWKGRIVDAKHGERACINVDVEEHAEDSSDEGDSGDEGSDKENKERFIHSKPTQRRVVNVLQHPLEPSKISRGKCLDDEIAGVQKPCPYSLRDKTGRRPSVSTGRSLGDHHSKMKQPNRTERQYISLAKEVPAVPDTTSRKVAPACPRTRALARQEFNDSAHQTRALTNLDVSTPRLTHALANRFPNIAPTALGKREREDSDEDQDEYDESDEESEDDYTPQARPTGSRSTQRRASKADQHPLASKHAARGARRAKDITDGEQKSQYTLRDATVAQTHASSSKSSGRHAAAKKQAVRAKRQRLSADDDDDYNEEKEAVSKKTGTKNATKAMKPCLWEDCDFSAPTTERYRHMLTCHFKDHKLRWKCAGSKCTAEFRRLDELSRHCRTSPSCLESGTWKTKTTLRSKKVRILYSAQRTGDPPWSKKEILECLRLPPDGQTGDLEREIEYWRQLLQAKPRPSLQSKMS